MKTNTKFWNIAQLMKEHAKFNFEKSYFELTAEEFDSLIAWMELVNYKGQHYGKSRSRSFYDTLKKYYKL